MLEALDHLILAVADLEAATAAYRALLGRAPSWRGAHPAYGTRNTLFRLDNTYVELLAADAGASSPLAAVARDTLGDRSERACGLAFGVRSLGAVVEAARQRGLRVSDPLPGEGVDQQSGRRRTWHSAFVAPESSGGLRVLLIEHTSAPEMLPPAADVTGDGSPVDAVDHVVIFTTNLEAAFSLCTNGFGLRELWRRDFPERGTRNIGLEIGGITLELIMRTDRAHPDTRHRFWGVSYAVRDCDRSVDRLRGAGIAVTDARPGLAPGTRVATVRWSGTPTLLIAPRR